MKEEISFTEPLWKFIEGLDQNNLAWATEQWLSLNCVTNRDKIQEFKKSKEEGITPTGLTAYFLNQNHKRELFRPEYMISVNEFITDQLSEAGLKSYLDYKKKVHPFNKSAWMKMTTANYWEMCMDNHKDLAQLALKFDKIHSSSLLEEFSTKIQANLDFDQYEKIATIYCSSKC